jgi:NAD(P)-dependent dehydrogenase (short-subunit alcohol dehydrogenase family)
MTTLAQLMTLTGRRAVVTGAAGRLGLIASQTLAELGADLVLVDRPGSDYARLTSELTRDWSVSVEAFDCDLEDGHDRERLIRTLTAGERPVDVLVNNAAFVGSADLTGWSAPFEQQSIETWRRALEVNLTAVFDLCKGLASRLQEGRGGCIVNIASIYGSLGPDYSLYAGTSMGNPAAYSASKGGLLQLTRWLATTLAPEIRVNSISPGGIFRDQPHAFVSRYEARTPLRRMAVEDDLRGAIAYLTSGLSSYCTGHDLVVDGGWGAW